MPDGAPSVPSVTASGSDHPVPVCVVDAMTDALARALVRTKNAGMNSHRLAARIGAVLWLLLAWVPAAQADEAAVTRGRYLATVANCVSCHTRPGGVAFAGGLPFVTDFGTLHSTNITSDPTAGIGRWSLEQFTRAMREGVDDEGQHLYPAFPYTAFTKLSDRDIADLYIFLKTIPASKQVAPPNVMKFPFDRRELLSVWKRMFFSSQRFVARADRSAEWNRGAYLVEGPAHCGACHTPRNLLGAEKASAAFAGGTHYDAVPGGAVRRWSAVNLTNSSSGLKAWRVEDIVGYLKTGHGERAGSFGPMNEVIVNSTSQMTDADLRAMAVYLKSLGAVDIGGAVELSGRARGAGETLYTIHCGTCHLPTGLGSTPGQDLGPPLAGSAVAQAPDPASLINIILYGSQVVRPTPPKAWKNMKPLYDALDDEQVAAVANYVRSSFGNRAGEVTAADVERQRSDD
jgi:mono/diheme cytochrome c family protein